MEVCSVVVELGAMMGRVRLVAAQVLASGGLVERVRSVVEESLLVLEGGEAGMVCYPRQP